MNGAITLPETNGDSAADQIKAGEGAITGKVTATTTLQFDSENKAVTEDKNSTGELTERGDKNGKKLKKPKKTIKNTQILAL